LRTTFSDWQRGQCGIFFFLLYFLPHYLITTSASPPFFRIRDLLANALMGPRVVEVRHIGFEHLL
jgi:hypothetical protein